MGLIKNLFGSKPNIEEELKTKEFEASSCSMECDSCHSKFPKTVGNLDNDSTLWNSTTPYGLHIVVPTGKTDWPHDACSEEGKLPNVVSKWGEENSNEAWGKVKVTVGSASSKGLESDEDYISQKKGDIFLLPFFIWVKNVSVDNVHQVLNKVVPSIVEARDKGASPELSLPEFPDVKLEIENAQAYIFLCSHKTRDKRCGITAPIMKKEMDIHLRELGLLRDVGDDRPDGVQVSFINHIGGHKYAANVIIYLKKEGKNIWFARCTPNNAVPIIEECVLNGGKVWPDKTRLIQKFKAISW